MTSISYQRPALWDVIERGGKAYNPFAWQAQHFHAREEKRVIAACGRRSGKSSAMKAEIVKEVVKPAEIVEGVEQYPLVYVVGPTSETAMKIWQPVWDLFVPPDSGKYEPPLGFMHRSHDKNRGWIQLINGAEIFRKTADDPRSLQGDRVTLAAIDEAHEIEDEAWENLMPALADSEGRMFALGPPKGRKRFRSYWELGQGKDPAFYSFSVPTHANPIFRKLAARAGFEDIVAYLRQSAIAADLTDDEFKRQVLAEWIEQDGQVFRNLDAVFTSARGGAHISQRNAMGVDVGKMHDFTVAYIGDLDTGRFINGDRFNGLSYTDAAPRIARLYRAFNCQYIHLDTTGVGEAFADMLRKEGCVIRPFIFSNTSKAGIVSTLVREVERSQVAFLRDDSVLRREMELFEAKVTGTTVRYEAPKGYYDDCVMAAALLVSEMAKRHRYQQESTRAPYVTFGDSPTWPSGRRKRVYA